MKHLKWPSTLSLLPSLPPSLRLSLAVTTTPHPPPYFSAWTFLYVITWFFSPQSRQQVLQRLFFRRGPERPVPLRFPGLQQQRGLLQLRRAGRTAATEE